MTAPEATGRAAGPSVLIVCHYYPPHVGGIEEVARAEARGLAAQGLSVTVMTSRPAARAATAAVDAGVRVVRVRAVNALERFGVPFPLFFPPSLLRRSWTEVRRADIVHVHDTLYMSSWTVALWCRLLHTPMVVTKHVAVVAHPWRTVALAQRLVYATFGRFICRGAGVVFYVNTGIRDSLVSGGTPPRVLVPLPNGVDLAAFAPATSVTERTALRRRFDLPSDSPLVLFVGRLVPKKGYRQLVDAAEGQDEWIAVLVGDGETVTRTGRVLPCGVRDRDSVRLLYQACDIFALPSRSEGFPLTVQEAMASGLPVVTTDDPGYDMYGLDPGFVTLLPADSPRLTEVITALAADPQRRRRMSLYSRRFAEEHFSWANHVNVLMGTFDEVMARPDAGATEAATPLVRS
jgi:glycosyltransferase involved in cell wall biosynthesis